jgi:two-component system, chemotaxis family, CheB/CheR fusion protein
MSGNSSDRNQRGGKKAKEMEDDFLIVGLGASAGGIQALREFFSKVPENSGMAYVVILHMSSEHESKLAEILQSTSLIPVRQVKAPIKVLPNNVYVIPPDQNLAMTDGHLQLIHKIGIEERRSPVDLFFRTLAETNDSRAVSVILSGTGANGSMGVKRIKEHGGVVIAQDPKEAQYKDMPRNAIATGMVDYVLPVGEIPAKILSYNAHRGSIQLLDTPTIAETDEESLRDIFTQLRMRTGHDFSNYKRPTMLRRIERRLGLKELSGLKGYAEYLRANRQEPQALMKDLLISVTNFFRDPESLEALAQKVIPAIVAGKIEEQTIRIWVPGCATGEEAYSIAMLFNETLADSASETRIQLFATDLDAEAIGFAREGYYTEAEVADIPPERLRRFFIKEHEAYRVRRELRETILFAAHNVLKDPPFSHLDLVSCRNLLIYLNRTAQKRVLEIMHFALDSAGYLFLGSSESAEASVDLFSTVDKDHHIFQSRPVPPRAVFPVPEISFKVPSILPLEKARTQQEVRAIERLSYLDLHQQMLEQFAPPSVIVNEHYDIVHLSDRAGQYLQMTGGEPSKNLLKLIRPELRLDLRTALYQSVQNRVQVQIPSLTVRVGDGANVKVRISIRPVLRETDPARGFILVVFEDDGPGDVATLAEKIRSTEPIARRLEEELMHSKSQLRATVEQYEIQQEELRASNEELQAMNEELRSSAEELETSKEELQSVNEELTTVNQELKIKVEELSHANNDFTNLMNSTDIGTIFLDRSLRIKLFTPRARDAFNLIPSDIGRPLLDITSKLSGNSLVTDIDQVVKTLHKVEREVASVEGMFYMMRILPYRTTEDRINGVVITLLDVTERKVATNELQEARGELEARVKERTTELAETNANLWLEVSERRQSESVRVKLLNQLVRSQESERRRIARDLHDQLGQQLTAIRLKLEALKSASDRREQLSVDVTSILSILNQLDCDVDFLAWELRPVVLDDLGLNEALKLYVEHWQDHIGIKAEFHSTGFDQERLPVEVENSLYRIAQEALNNAAKHSESSRVEVLLERRDDHAVLIIEDNGVGFRPDEEDMNEGFGLSGMRERAALMGASFEIESSPEKGTTLYVKTPLNLG